MFYALLISLVLSEIEDAKLPYDDILDQKIPPSHTPIPNNEDEIDDPDSPLSLYIILGLLAAFFVLSFLSYSIGSFYIKSHMTFFQQTLNKFLQQMLHTDKIQFMQYGVHKFEAFIKSYQKHIHGCIVEVEMCLQIDVFHRLKYHFVQKIDQVSFEFLIHPPKPTSAMIHVSKEPPFFNQDFNLVEMELAEDYKFYTDIKGHDKKFIADIKSFIEKHPNLIDFIEMTDANRFKAKDKCGYVVKICLNIRNFEKDIDMGVLRFCFDLASAFSAINLPDYVITANKRKRDKLLADAKVRLEKIRQFQEAQRIYKETGIFPTPEELEKMQQQEKEKRDEEAKADENNEVDDDIYFEAIPISSLQNEESQEQSTEPNNNTKIKQE